ncbi:PEPxxWA-CTERM sorting domain-containing protein [Polymorphobacter sp. PAMC 29334]|uniref:PEPxxWA-CTERM sorting domain-containing protein n=1 Tax=Polymorphobacter sp. PAMC 29334 TaxID=2862331 RepID=UPI001D00AF92|nr:PEPxxWA-CTERM sorting domain-containing protein [Polymorphobacter sp. PAMC 29334]
MGLAVKSIVALAAILGASAPAAAYSTRYEVQHYPQAYTRTVNQALGTHVETYTDGSVVTLGFGVTPSPSLSITAVQGGPIGFFIEDLYQFDVAIQPTTAAAQAFFVNLGLHPSHVKIGEATGHITLAASKVFGSNLDASVAQGRGGSVFEVNCDSGVGAQCGRTAYHTSLFTDLAQFNPYICTTGPCGAVPFGTPITLSYTMESVFSLNAGAGAHASLLIDPTISLDADTLASFGLTAADFTITPEAGFGNTAVAGGVPEPAAWVLLVAGFGFVGGAMRMRGQGVVA